MSRSLAIDTLEFLPRTPATDLKKLGWRGVMKSVGRSGKIVVTNHNQPEAVNLSAEAYTAITDALQQAAAQADAPLEALRSRFDARLAVLQAPDAGDKLRSLMAPGGGGMRLNGQVRAG